MLNKVLLIFIFKRGIPFCTSYPEKLRSQSIRAASHIVCDFLRLLLTLLYSMLFYFFVHKYSTSIKSSYSKINYTIRYNFQCIPRLWAKLFSKYSYSKYFKFSNNRYFSNRILLREYYYNNITINQKNYI